MSDWQANTLPDIGDCICEEDPCRCSELEEERAERAAESRAEDMREMERLDEGG